MIVYPEELMAHRIAVLEALVREVLEVLADDEAILDTTWRKRAYAALGGKQ